MAKICGAMCISMGFTWVLPILFELSQDEELSRTAKSVVWLGPMLILVGSLLLVWGFRMQKTASMPVPVRMAITLNVLFLSFCALEFSDGFVRQGGRIFYWTSALFLPALAILFGLGMACRWSWWIARVFTLLGTLFFFILAAAIPFGDIRASGEPVGGWGRAWMVFVTLVFLSATLFVFRALGHAETRRYFGILDKPEPGAKPNPDSPGAPPGLAS